MLHNALKNMLDNNSCILGLRSPRGDLEVLEVVNLNFFDQWSPNNCTVNLQSFAQKRYDITTMVVVLFFLSSQIPQKQMMQLVMYLENMDERQRTSY